MNYIVTGFYHLIPVWVEMDRCGNLTVKNLIGDEAWFQEGYYDHSRLLNELPDCDKEELERGWPVMAIVNDEQWAAYTGEEY